MSIHGESHMNSYHGGLNRPRKKSLGSIFVTLSSQNFKAVYITNKKNVSIPVIPASYC